MTTPSAMNGVPDPRLGAGDGPAQARVLVACPNAGVLLDTGLRMDPERFRRFRPRNARVFCTTCATSHRWTQDDAILEDAAVS